MNFQPPSPFSESPSFFLFLIPQILKSYLISLTLSQKFTFPFQNPGSAPGSWYRRQIVFIFLWIFIMSGLGWRQVFFVLLWENSWQFYIIIFTFFSFCILIHSYQKSQVLVERERERCSENTPIRSCSDSFFSSR